MKLIAQIFLAALVIGESPLPLFAQHPVSGNHLDERALDALKTEKPKWWKEVQRIMRDPENASLKMEMVQYLLARSFIWIIWKEGDPRDSETRSAILMLAEDVAVSLNTTLGSMPDFKLILTSDAYRSELLAALHTSQNSNIAPTDAVNKSRLDTNPIRVLHPSAPKKWTEAMPIPAPDEKLAPPTLWSMIAAAFGLLFCCSGG